MTRAEYDAKYGDKPQKGVVDRALDATLGDFFNSAVFTPAVRTGQALGAVGLKTADKLSGGKVDAYVQGKTGQSLDDRIAVASEKPTQLLNFPEIKAQPKTVKGALAEGTGNFAKGASYVVGGGGTAQAVKAGLGGAVKQGVVQGAKTGFVGGGSYLFGESVQEKDATLKSVATKTALGAAGGALFGGALGGAVPLTAKAGARIVENRMAKASAELDNLVGTIAQGTKEDIAKAKNALTQIETEGIKSYGDLKGAFDDKIKAVSTKLDDVLDTDTTIRSMDELSVTTKVGNQNVKHNYVVDAFDQLDELYSKTNDPVALARLRQLREKADTVGLTIREVNDLSRQHGSEFKSKAFSKLGDPLTSVNAQAFENTRSGLKGTAREQFKNQIYQEADEVLSDLLRTRQLVVQVDKAVQKLKQRVTERGLGEQAGRILFQVIDKFTGGGIKGFVQSFIPRSGGLKIMNALDLERNLGKNLKKLENLLNKVDDLPEADIIKELNKLLRGDQDSTVFLNNQSTSKTNKTVVMPSTIQQNGGKVNLPSGDNLKKKPNSQGLASVGAVMGGALGTGILAGNEALAQKNKVTYKKPEPKDPVSTPVRIVSTSKDKHGTIHKLESGITVREIPKEIGNAITNASARAGIPRGLLAAVVMQESSMGTNASNSNPTIGKNAWWVGFTKIATKELKRRGKAVDLSTPQGAIQAAADYLALSKGKHKGIAEWYDKGYSSGKLPPHILKQFEEIAEFYSNQ